MIYLLQHVLEVDRPALLGLPVKKAVQNDPVVLVLVVLHRPASLHPLLTPWGARGPPITQHRSETRTSLRGGCDDLGGLGLHLD